MPKWSARQLTAEDLALVEAVFQEREHTHGEKLGRLWYTMTDVPTIMQAIRTGEVQSRIVGGYLVCFSVGRPWYSKDAIVSEELVLNLYGGMNFDAVTEFLEIEAEAHGAAYVSTGTALATHPRALIRLYERRGYVQQSTELLKAV